MQCLHAGNTLNAVLHLRLLPRCQLSRESNYRQHTGPKTAHRRTPAWLCFFTMPPNALFCRRRAVSDVVGVAWTCWARDLWRSSVAPLSAFRGASKWAWLTSAPSLFCRQHYPRCFFYDVLSEWQCVAVWAIEIHSDNGGFAFVTALITSTKSAHGKHGLLMPL